MSQKHSEETPIEKPVYETNYEFCPTCERRINKVIFAGHATCARCRGEYDTGEKEEKIDASLINT